ncbi:hypothetical protein Tco_1068175 [Tanacetum coccineum]|uniref:Uncharacterized protein n=1 Tax=Tanacetum coccineum TaxID=301880 RepID=A0ABQ5HF15_9ASTR
MENVTFGIYVRLEFQKLVKTGSSSMLLKASASLMSRKSLSFKRSLALLATKDGLQIGSLVFGLFLELNPSLPSTNGGGWMSSELGSSVSFVTSLSFFRTTGGRNWRSIVLQRPPLRRGNCLVFAFPRIGMVLLVKELELARLVGVITLHET